MPPCLKLNIIRYGLRVKWSNPGKGVAPSLHLSVVANEKGAFGLPSTTVANFTYLHNHLCNFQITHAECITAPTTTILQTTSGTITAWTDICAANKHVIMQKSFDEKIKSFERKT